MSKDERKIDFEIETDTFSYEQGTLHFNTKWRDIIGWIQDEAKLSDIINEIGSNDLLEAIGIDECKEYFDLIEKPEEEK